MEKKDKKYIIKVGQLDIDWLFGKQGLQYVNPVDSYSLKNIQQQTKSFGRLDIDWLFGKQCLQYLDLVELYLQYKVRYIRQ